MYGYYLLVEMKLLDRRHGGKFITPIQLIQFVLCLFSAIYETFHPEQCGTDMSIAFWLWMNYIIFLIFFLNIFYQKSTERTNRRVEQNNDKKTQ